MLIKKCAYKISSPQVKMCPPADRPEYAFIGRSNVGKSSLINMLCGKKNLAKVSGTPGKTQLINHYEIESKDKAEPHISKWYLVDLPGYGYAKVAQKKREVWSKMIRDYLLQRKNLLQVFVLIDSRHTPQKIDLEFIQNLGHAQIPFTLIFTKADKEKPTVVKRNEAAFLNALLTFRQFLPPSIITSAEKKTGREEVLAIISGLNASYLDEKS